MSIVLVILHLLGITQELKNHLPEMEFQIVYTEE